MLVPAAEKGRESGNADKAPVMEEIGNNLALSNAGLEKKIYIHYAKPPCNNDGVCDPGEKGNCSDCKAGSEEPTPTCYEISNGVAWKDLPQAYVVDPDNGNGLSQAFLENEFQASVQEWDSHTSANLFSGYTIDHAATWDGYPGDVPDGRNELLFGDYPEQGVIAIAVTWGYFNGPPWNRRIIEFDVLFDTDYAWGNATVDANKMDVRNIATHEIGHGLGLGDIYDAACSDVTMYGYSGYGETKKRSPEPADIEGLQLLYGS